ncbi:TRAP transporter substrate-binding protein [Pokkaliibacter plantistimulans]|uniref:TRAP transporter substrate-binding protein n=1 Tax=Pokkaliibacter plantistimulans TaxID=1635171 RepID=UPI000D74A95D|nr:TRAP transporter substrate-binding protein [Pokkaliibacter plantistimulans]
MLKKLATTALLFSLSSIASHAEDKIVFAISGTPNSRPINTPADLQGLKIRTPQSEWRTLMFSTWGANPTPMASSELFVALQTGMVDGQENPLSNINGAKLQELSISNHVYSPILLTVSEDGWNKLPAEVQNAITEVAVEAQSWSFAKGESLDKSLQDNMTQAGTQINQVDRQAVIAASKTVYAKFIEKVDGGQQLVDRVMALAGE